MKIEDLLVPNRLREVRVSQNLRQWQLQILSNASLSRISQIENGAPATETEKTKLAKGLGITVAEIWPDF